MKNIERVRQEVVAHTERFLDHLRVRWSLYFGDDPDLLAAIDRPRHADLTVLLADTLMRELGDKRPGAKNPRFDKTRRAVAKHSGLSRRERAARARGEFDGG